MAIPRGGLLLYAHAVRERSPLRSEWDRLQRYMLMQLAQHAEPMCSAAMHWQQPQLYYMTGYSMRCC